MRYNASRQPPNAADRQRNHASPDAMLDSNSFDDLSFIYHPDDLEFVRRLAAQLSARDIRCRLDENEYGDTESGRQRLMDGILRSYTVAMVLTPSSAESQLCNALIEFAVINGKRFVTLIVNEEIAVDVHPAIAAYPYIFFRQQDDFEAGIATLCDSLQADEHLRFHTELLVQAHRWDRQQRTRKLLLAPDRIERARSWLAEGARLDPKPSQLQVEYIHASRRQKPTPKRAVSTYIVAMLALVVVVVALILVRQSVVGNQAAATATAEFMATSESERQTALSVAATATAQSNSSARLLANLAATSGSIARQIRGTAEAEILQATSQAGLTLTAEAQTILDTANQRATEMARIDRELAAQSVLESAEDALDAGDVDLALALAWDIASSYEEPNRAYPLLRRIAALAPRLMLEAVASTRIQPGGAQIAVIPRSFDRVAVYDGASASLVYEILDHDGELSTLAYSRDGTRLITATDNGELVIRAAENGEALQQLEAHQGPVTALAFSNDGQLIYSAGQDPVLATWDLETGEALARYEADSDEVSPPRELLVSADESRLYGWSVVGGKSVMGQWSAETLEILSADTGGRVYLGYDNGGHIAYSGGRSIPAFAGDPNTGDLALWDLNSGQQIARLADGFNWSILGGSGIASATDGLLFLTFAPDDVLVAVADSSGAQRTVLVNLTDPTLYQTFDNDLATRLTSAHFVDGQAVLSARDDGQLVLWSALDGSLIRMIGIAPHPLHSIAVSDDGAFALGQAANGSVYLWNIAATQLPLRTVENAEAGTALNQTGEALLVAEAGESRLLEIESGRDLLRIAGSRVTVMNRSGSRFAAFDGDEVGVYDAQSGARVSQWTVEFDDLSDIYLAPDGDMLIVTEASGALYRLRADVDEPQLLNTGALGPPILVRFADNDSGFLTVHAERALLWDAISASPLRSHALGVPAGFPLDEHFDAVLSQAGDRMLFFVRLDNGIAGVTEIAPDTDLVRRHTFVNVERGALTSDGDSLVLTLLDRTIEIVDTASDEVIFQLEHNEEALRKPRYLAATQRLYAMAENRLQIYDIRSGAIEQEFGHARELNDFSINDRGDVALTLDGDGVYRAWQVESGEQLLRRIESELRPRELTCEERDQYRALPLCES